MGKPRKKKKHKKRQQETIAARLDTLFKEEKVLLGILLSSLLVSADHGCHSSVLHDRNFLNIPSADIAGSDNHKAMHVCQSKTFALYIESIA